MVQDPQWRSLQTWYFVLKVKLCKHIKLRILVDCRHFVKKKKRALQFLNGSWKAFCLPILCEIIHPWRLFCLLTLLHLRCLSRCQKHDRTPAPRSRWSGALTQCVYPTPLAAPWAVNNDTGGSLTFNSLQVGGTFSNSRFTQTLMDFTTIQKKKCLVSFTGTEKKKWYIHLLRVKDGVHKSRNQNRIQKRQQKYISLYNKLLVVWHYSQTYFVCLYTECAHRL